MDYLIRWIDVTPNLTSGQQPVFMLERPYLHDSGKVRTGTFWVPQASLEDPSTQWSVTESGDFVRVPVMAYRTRERAMSLILGTGLQLGIAAIMSLRHHTQDEPISAVLLLGHEVSDLPDKNAFRVYVGLALRTH
ncbi:MAG: hypothetical protein L0312_16255 [Acidobacteria bacterium]|nr:hypothetical protein [Acidobacteriota bacterium]